MFRDQVEARKHTRDYSILSKGKSKDEGYEEDGCENEPEEDYYRQNSGQTPGSKHKQATPNGSWGSFFGAKKDTETAAEKLARLQREKAALARARARDAELKAERARGHKGGDERVRHGEHGSPSTPRVPALSQEAMDKLEKAKKLKELRDFSSLLGSSGLPPGLQLSSGSRSGQQLSRSPATNGTAGSSVAPRREAGNHEARREAGKHEAERASVKSTLAQGDSRLQARTASGPDKHRTGNKSATAIPQGRNAAAMRDVKLSGNLKAQPKQPLIRSKTPESMKQGRLSSKPEAKVVPKQRPLDSSAGLKSVMKGTLTPKRVTASTGMPLSSKAAGSVGKVAAGGSVGKAMGGTGNLKASPGKPGVPARPAPPRASGSASPAAQVVRRALPGSQGKLAPRGRMEGKQTPNPMQGRQKELNGARKPGASGPGRPAVKAGGREGQGGVQRPLQERVQRPVGKPVLAQRPVGHGVARPAVWRPGMGAKRRREDDEGSLDSFVVSDEDEGGFAAVQRQIHKMFRYDPGKRRHEELDVDDMEVGFRTIQAEEAKSARIARDEDDREALLLEAEERRKKAKKKKKAGQKGFIDG